MASVKSLTIGGKTIFDLVYPVGSIYETDNEGFDPKTSFGGTWKRIKGKVIVGVDKEDGAFDTVGKTGGEKAHTLTIAEMPSHNHPNSSTTNMDWGQDWVDGKKAWSGKSSHQKDWRQDLIISSQGGGRLTTICLHTMLHIFGEEQLKKLFLRYKKGGK